MGALSKQILKDQWVAPPIALAIWWTWVAWDKESWQIQILGWPGFLAIPLITAVLIALIFFATPQG